MRDFAPVPFRALTPGTLSDSALRLLSHFLMVWVNQRQPKKVELSDYELLRGQRGRLLGRRPPACGLTRNTMKRARTELEDLGFIKCEFLREENQEHVYSYELVKGMALDREHNTPQQGKTVDDDHQQMTLAASEGDSLYIAEKETNPATGSRDGEERRSRELPALRVELLEKAFGLLSELYPQHHPRRFPLPNPGSVRSVLRNFLLDNPEWTEEVILNGIRHYYQSENTNKATSPERWLRRIPEFSTGPLDQYSRPVALPDRSHARQAQQSNTYSLPSSASVQGTTMCDEEDDSIPF